MTDEQNTTNDYLISLKEHSDKEPEQKPAFTVWVNREGEMRLSIAKGVSLKNVRLACSMIGLYGIETP